MSVIYYHLESCLSMDEFLKYWNSNDANSIAMDCLWNCEVIEVLH